MLKTSLWEVQKALFNRLSNDTALSQKITGVFDEVEEGQAFPYVTLGEPTVNPFETKTSYGEDIPWVLHCWSQYSGKKECYEILNLMLQAITKEPFVIEGFSLLRVKIEPNMQVITDIDEITKHGILRIRFIINN
jgi:Protein of unknown function (DUF3168)